MLRLGEEALEAVLKNDYKMEKYDITRPPTGCKTMPPRPVQ